MGKHQILTIMGMSVDSKRVTGVYAIEVPSLKKVYIGQSVDVSTRIRQHRSVLKRNTCKNKEIQADWNNCASDFSFKLLEPCWQVNLIKKETEYCKKYAQEGWHLYNAIISTDKCFANIPVEHKDFIYELMKAIDSGKVTKDQIRSLYA